MIYTVFERETIASFIRSAIRRSLSLSSRLAIEKKSTGLNRWSSFRKRLVVRTGAQGRVLAGAAANRGLCQAQEFASKWQVDATLVQIITVSGNRDGIAENGSYLFHSPQAKKGTRWM